MYFSGQILYPATKQKSQSATTLSHVNKSNLLLLISTTATVDAQKNSHQHFIPPNFLIGVTLHNTLPSRTSQPQNLQLLHHAARHQLSFGFFINPLSRPADCAPLLPPFDVGINRTHVIAPLRAALCSTPFACAAYCTACQCNGNEN